MKKANVKMNKPIFLGMSILDISKILVHELWCDYGDKAKICYTDTDTFVIYIATEDFFEDTADNVKIRFDTSNIDENDKRPLGIGKNTKTPGLFKLKSGGKIIIEVVALIAKPWSYLMDDGSEHKKAKGIKKAVIKKKICLKIIKNVRLMMKIYENCNKHLKVNFTIYIL